MTLWITAIGRGARREGRQVVFEGTRDLMTADSSAHAAEHLRWYLERWYVLVKQKLPERHSYSATECV